MVIATWNGKSQPEEEPINSAIDWMSPENELVLNSILTGLFPNAIIGAWSLDSFQMGAWSLDSFQMGTWSLESGFFPNGSMESGLFPNGSMESGFFPNGSMESGFFPNGSMESGFFPKESFSNITNKHSNLIHTVTITIAY